MLHTFIFIGRSGCGKGTQADLLRELIHQRDEEKRQILYVETGEHFRKFVRGDTYSSRLAKKVDEEGERQPDFLACQMWGHILVEELDENMHLFFDGAPRSYPESLIMDTVVKFYKRKNPTVIYVNVSRKWSEERLLARGRSDDRTLTKIDARLDWFDHETMGAVEHFKKSELYNFIEIDGEQSIEKVHSDIVAAYKI